MLLANFCETNKISRIGFWNRDTLKEETKDAILASAKVLVQTFSSTQWRLHRLCSKHFTRWAPLQVENNTSPPLCYVLQYELIKQWTVTGHTSQYQYPKPWLHYKANGRRESFQLAWECNQGETLCALEGLYARLKIYRYYSFSLEC